MEAERRLALRSEGKLEFLGGKQELIRLGEFDDVDMAVMCHTASNMGNRTFSMGGTSNGHMVKYVEYMHPTPDQGATTLHAANLAMAAIHSNRDTFREDMTARIHGIVIRAGEPGVQPGDVALEWRVRSSTPEDLEKNSAMVDRCFKAGALAVGARVRITNIPGYLPLRHDSNLQDLFHSNATYLLGRDRTSVLPPDRNRGGSTDMGDLSQIMPVCHPYTGGATGPGHSKEYTIADYERAVINPAKIMAMVVIHLLADGAVKAREVLGKARPAVTKDEYVQLQRERAGVEAFDGSDF